jgi:predicted RNA-binding protein (virulence factor B family)
MIEVGVLNELVVCDENSSGYYLKAEDSDEKAFMPPSLGPKDVKVGDRVKAFIYLDTSDCLLGTTNYPSAVVGQFALMNVVETTHFGAFMNWGITKDLLIPDSEQKEPIRYGEDHIVRVCIDERTEKIFGTTKLGKHIQASKFDIEEGVEVDLVPAIKESLGYRCVVNRKFIGMIYHNEIFKEIIIGKPLRGVVKKIREDGLVDCALQVQGVQNLFDSKDVILNFLKENDGKSDLHDKSKPDDIRAALGMSKQTFKNSIGMLYREKKIIIRKDGIELVVEKEL